MYNPADLEIDYFFLSEHICNLTTRRTFKTDPGVHIHLTELLLSCTEQIIYDDLLRLRKLYSV